jgi:hypothetical protein
MIGTLRRCRLPFVHAAAVAFILVAWPRVGWSQSGESDAEFEDGAAAVDWIQAFVVPERLEAAAEIARFGEYATLGTQCPTVPAATDYATGRNGVDVIVYGYIKRCSRTWPYPCTNTGMGACIFDWSSSGGTCHIGTPYGHDSVSSTANPYGVKGDGSAAGSTDEIYPASYCSTSAITCDSVPGFDFKISMTGVPADAQWEICGDDCSISSGSGDIIYGWSNRDIIFAGGGWDDAYGQGGSDCIFGDDGNDFIVGGSCVAGDDEYLWGLNGDDLVSGNSGTCTRYITGSAGVDTLKGGDGPDYIYGGGHDDNLFGFGGVDVCNGEDHVTGDYCDPSPSCNTVQNCSP